jgi:hypothetical protein
MQFLYLRCFAHFGGRRQLGEREDVDGKIWGFLIFGGKKKWGEIYSARGRRGCTW